MTQTVKKNDININPSDSNFELDCMSSRVLAKSGIYTCPLLINDYRGRCGATLSDYSKKCYLETEECQKCKNFGQKIYSNNWA